MSYTFTLDTVPTKNIVKGEAPSSVEVRIYDTAGRNVIVTGGTFKYTDSAGNIQSIPLTSLGTTLSNRGIFAVVWTPEQSALFPVGLVPAQIDFTTSSGSFIAVNSRALKVDSPAV